jgi:uncharacterized membrane protein (DUF4010 family)
MDLLDSLPRFAVALGIGLLIGLERGWHTREMEPGTRAAGIRTFTISSLLGATAGALARAITDVGFFLGATLVAFAAIIILFSWGESRTTGRNSATTAIAALLTFSLGAFSVLGDMRVAAAAAVGTAGILAAREDIHSWVARITWPELRSALVWLAMTFIVLPVIPDDPIGPFGGVNPRQIWLIAIALAGVSFLGYVGVRVFGARQGILLSSAAGGLVSSTAVTVTNARRAANEEAPAGVLAAGVAIASGISFVRVIVIVAALQPALLWLIVPALLVATLVAGVAGFLPLQGQARRTKPATPTTFRNPFAFWSVIAFAIFLGFVVVAARIVGERVGATGVILSAAIAGFADVDAITVSIAKLTSISAQSAALAILTAVATNTVSKLVVGVLIGSGRFALCLAGFVLACLSAAGIAFWITPSFVPP